MAENKADWSFWSGGPNPVGNEDVVDLRFRDGEELLGEIARLYDWLHSPSRSADDDIVEYRLSATQPGEV